MDVLPILCAQDGRTSPFCTIEGGEIVVHGQTNFVPENMQVFTSALSGGNFAEYLQEAIRTDGANCALLLEALCHEFMFPSADGQGVKIDECQLELLRREYPSQFSEDLCCNYIYNPSTPSVALFDDETSLLKKYEIAKELQFSVLICNEDIYKKIKTP